MEPAFTAWIIMKAGAQLSVESNKPKYLKLKEYIIDTIISNGLKPGEKIHSENELAAEFEICRHTVRQAIGELVNDGWLYREHGKGTFVNKRPDMDAAGPRTVAVITTYLNDYIFPAIIRGIDSVLSKNGYTILLGCTYNLHEKERLCLENLKNQNIAALIAEPTKSALPNPNLGLYRDIEKSGIPVLFIHGCYKDVKSSYVVEDDEQAGYIATRHLVGLGHKKIGGIFKIDDIQGHSRFSGFSRALREDGLMSSDSQVIWFDTGGEDEKISGFTSKKLSAMLHESTAVVCYNEQIAIRLMDAIRCEGLSVPEDISLVSFDDSQLAVASEVKLTTVAHPKEKLGEEAGKTVIEMIAGHKGHFEIKMQPELVVRSSTRKLE
jgi:GntR family transcriptional regulator of arabinose operon